MLTVAPCFYVKGNHEARLPDYPLLEEGLRNMGVTVLRNERRILRCGDEHITLMGMDCPYGDEDYPFFLYDLAEASEGFKLLLICCVVYANAFWLMNMLFPQLFVGLFTPDQALAAYAVPCVRIYMLATGIFGIQMACQQTFVAIGNAKCSLFVACLRKIILLIPLIYLMPAVLPIDKVHAVFWAEPVADTLSVTAAACLFFPVSRKTLRQLEQN
jgi:hypothetical protein